LFLPLQVRARSPRTSNTFRPVGVALLDQDVRRVQAQRLPFDRRAGFFLERRPDFERLIPLRLRQIVKRLRVTIAKFKAVRRQLGRSA